MISGDLYLPFACSDYKHPLLHVIHPFCPRRKELDNDPTLDAYIFAPLSYRKALLSPPSTHTHTHTHKTSNKTTGQPQHSIEKTFSPTEQPSLRRSRCLLLLLAAAPTNLVHLHATLSPTCLAE